jgi:O-antigen ligase
MVSPRKKTKAIAPPRTLHLVFIILAGFSVLVLPFITVKAALDISLVPRLLAMCLLLAVITLALLHERNYPLLDLSVLKKAAFPVYAGFFVLSAISLAFAINLSAGYFDLAKVFMFLVLLAYLCLILPKTPDWQKKLTAIVVLASLLTLAVGYYEYITKLGFGIHGRGSMSSIKGLMSNVNLYANSLLLMVPYVTFALFIHKKIWRFLAGVALAGLLLMIILLQTRATYVGLIAGIGTVILASLIFYKELGLTKKLRLTILLVSVAAATLFTIFIATANPDNPMVSRFKSIFDDSSDGGRTLIWTITTEMIADQPLSGVGAGNFPIRIQEYYGGHDFGDAETNWMRPHNDFLWVLSEKGIFGLALFLGFFFLGFFYVRHILKSQSTPHDKWMAVFSAMGLASYMVNSAFDFPLERINQQVYLALFMAAIIVLYHQVKPETKPIILKEKKTFAAVILVLLLTGSVFSYKAIMQEIHTHRARAYQMDERYEAVLASARLAKTPWKTLDPLGVPIAFLEGVALSKLNDVQGAIIAFQEAERHNPYRKYLQNNLANTYLMANENEKAIVHANKTLEMFNNDDEALRILATAYFQSDRYQEALSTLERIPEEDRTTGIRSNILFIQRAIQEQTMQQQTNQD